MRNGPALRPAPTRPHMAWPIERSHYRIDYPILERPVLEVQGVPHAVLDCSERGIRYRFENAEPIVGAVVTGTVRFHDGAAIEVTGVVVRRQDSCAALALEKPGIPLKLLLDEQRRLRRRYPQRQ